MADADPLWDAMGDAPPDPGAAPAPAPDGGAPATASDSDPLWDAMGPPPPNADPMAPPPARPPGPPRLKGERTPMPRRAPPPRPGPRPSGAPPPPPPKPENLSWSSVAHGALANAPTSFVNQLHQTLAPLAPWHWGEDWTGAKAIATGLASKAGLIDQGNAAAQAQHQQAVNAIGKMYTDRYGSVEGFKRTLKHDPFAIGSDIATVATLPIGGEGLAAKAPGVVGDVLGAAAKAGRVAQLADPTMLAAKGAGLAGRAGVGVIRKVGSMPLVGRAVRGAIGAGVGHAVGAHIPFVGPWAGTVIGEHVAEGLMPKAHPPANRWTPYQPGGGAAPAAPGLIDRALSKPPPAGLPAVGTFGGMQPMSPAEQAAQDAQDQQDQGGAGAPGAPPAGGVGDTDNDTIANQIMYHEGGLGGQKNPGSSAQGPYQMTNDTWVGQYKRDYPRQAAGMTDDQIKQYRQTDEGQNLTAQLGRNYVDYEAGLVKNLGMPLTSRNVYTIHFLGEGGGPRLLRALRDDPSVAGKPLSDYVSPTQIAANPFLAHMRTVQDFLNWEDGAMQDGQQKWARAEGRTQLAQGYADGGKVIDLTDRLMARAEREGRASRTATKPLLGLDDTTVAKALAVAGRAI